jgi:hypothetical protein
MLLTKRGAVEPHAAARKGCNCSFLLLGRTAAVYAASVITTKKNCGKSLEFDFKAVDVDVVARANNKMSLSKGVVTSTMLSLVIQRCLGFIALFLVESEPNFSRPGSCRTRVALGAHGKPQILLILGSV